MKKTSVFALLLVGTMSLVAWAEPTIHVAWDETETLIPDFHYVIDTTDADFPNIQLKAGSLTWRVWSVDENGEPDDIGEISSPASANFGVRIINIVDEEQSDPGARNIKAIRLIPTNSGNYSNITGGTIAGNIEEELTVQAISSQTGAVTLTVNGSVSADVSINNVETLYIHTVSSTGSLNIENLSGSLRVENLLEGATVDIQTVLGATTSVFGVFQGVLDIAEVSNTTDPGDDFDPVTKPVESGIGLPT